MTHNPARDRKPFFTSSAMRPRRPSGRSGVSCTAGVAMLAAALAGSNAAAQPMISGQADIMFRSDWGSSLNGRVNSLAPGNSLSSRVTFRDLEELGDGWRAASILELGYNLDDGTPANSPPGATGGFTFGRLAFVGLGSDRTGYLTFGRQYTPIGAISASGGYDPFGAGFLGGIVNLDSVTIRASNALIYHYGYGWEGMRRAAPKTGLGVVAMVALGEAQPPAPRSAGNQAGFAVSYGTERWWAGYAYHRQQGNSPATSVAAPVSDQPRLQQQTLGASYVIGNTRLLAGVNTGKNDAAGAAALDRLNWHVGVASDLTPSTWVAALYGKANDRTPANRDFATYQLGAGYYLSRRTMLYAVVGVGDNNANASYVLPNALGRYAPGDTARSAVVGLRHSF